MEGVIAVATEDRRSLWQIPLTVLACVAGSVVIVWMVSAAMNLTMDASLVAVLSAVLSAVAIAAELRGRGARAR